MTLSAIFKPDSIRYDGVRPINIYLLRLLYVLIVVFVGTDALPGLFQHQGTREPFASAAVAMWASFAVLSSIGILYPLKMLPLVLFEILYKVLWLIAIALPLWSEGQLLGSPNETMTYSFLTVLLPIVAVPWKFVWNTYILNRES